METTNPRLFVLGSSGSGTALLQRMLDNHPDLAVANDTHFIPHAIKDLSANEDLPLTLEIVENTRTYRRFHRLGIPDEAVDKAAEVSETYSEFVGALYTEFAAMRGKTLGGEKTPDYLTELPTLHALFPQAKFVHIIRDGRDVALSVAKWADEDKGPGKLEHWREEPMAVCALWWKRQIEAAMRDGRSLGPEKHHKVRYEDLVADPEESLREMSAFLGLPYSEKMANFHEGKAVEESGKNAKKAWLPPTKGLRDWRCDMSGRDAALFEALAGDLLSELGYERSAETLPPEVEETAARLRDWWENAPSRRRRPRAFREVEP